MSLKNLMDLNGRVALITGGSRGLGLQMGEALGELGAKLAITARKPDELEQAAEHLRGQGIEVLPVQADIGDFDGIPGLVDTVVQHYGNIDILVNNAGTSWGAAAEEHPKDGWDKVMNVNVNGLWLLTQEVGRRCMIPNNYGKIVNTASVAGLLGNPLGVNTIAYNTSKGAVVNFTRALGAEWGKYNITVNAICPGVFPSKMAQTLVDNFSKQIIASTPLQRLGGEEDLKGLVAYFATDASRHVTGQYVAVDGGASII
ncbi:SDR family oxidoreductase [Ectothiorhodospiraceae bacterium WFHF3C12]|nr:SDR family oxidoreductase [Ectothiorhodospiraceae bacterium WFHF3C12]